MAKKSFSPALHKVSSLPPTDVSESEIRQLLPQRIKKLAEIQDKLYAQKKYAVLVIFQGMDASGKDGAVKHVFSGVNPAGCKVKSFKVPTEEEASHDFLWRIHRECPERGMIQIFNRSHYEDVLVPFVHKQLDKEAIRERMEAINHFEDLLIKNQTIVFKFYLHVSENEQLNRINERLEKPEKRWKYQASDIIETRHREDYLKIYQKLMKTCQVVPWTIIPSDKNWYKNFLIVETLLQRLQSLDIHYPPVVEG